MPSAVRPADSATFGPKPPTVIGGGGVGLKEPTDSGNRARPDRPHRDHSLLERISPSNVARHGPAQSKLFGRVGRAPPTAGAHTYDQTSTTHLLQRGGHDGKCPGISIGDVENHRPDGDAAHRGRDRRQCRPALEDPICAVYRAGEVVIYPHSIEALTLGHNGSLAHVRPCDAEGIE